MRRAIMMTLTTISEVITDTKARVFWRVGTKNKGIIDLNLRSHSEDSALVGELMAIQYLLFDKKVFDRAPGGGGGYKLVVSKGAIKKLALGKSSKKFAVKYASFLLNRMKGVTIEVSQKLEFMANSDETLPLVIEEDKDIHTQEYAEIITPAMGPVKITQHAVEQYEERISSGCPKKPWASLTKRLMHPELRIQPLDAKILAHKERKYGRSDNVEAWSHPTSTFTYLIVLDDKGNRVLVTVFERYIQPQN
jgi:hypothetical protein